MQTPEEEKFFSIFYPYSREKFSTAREKGTRFVHYTSADAAMCILKNKEVWMRKSSCMNDFTEVQYGLKCLSEAYQKSGFKAILDRIFDGLSAEIEQLFDSWTFLIYADTYLTCFSEHEDREDTIGRLSMWRAYGGETGVALVLNNSPFITPSETLKAYSSPVAYLNAQVFAERFGMIATNIEKEAEFVRQQGREAIKNRVFAMFRFAAVSTKHPGFAEEKEWRIVFSPSLAKSDHLTKSIEVVRGIPQPVYKIPLVNIPAKEGQDGLSGIEIPEIIERIIIGPTRYPLALGEAFLDLLQRAGMSQEEAGKKIVSSDIPLRQ